ncbi:J domain-containing protein [Haloarchaeobius sp. HRN-SO-5]|uniref:J domain-containing protein n=1 Tax=Haloarchaeobius sp. HRN-SO-5 TaxID=3446118 RepID=UPI003EBDD1CF
MAVVERHACEGCGRVFSLDNLTTVTMPGGSQTACCPECREYAETVASGESDIDQRQRECEGCTRKVLVSELEEVILPDGTGVLCCSSCAEHAPRRDGGSDASHRNERQEAETAVELQSRDPSKASRRRNLCQHCNDWYSIELYRVVTLDDRTEKFCPDCVEDARDEGIIKDVRMRRTEAYEVLGCTGFTDEDDLRDTYVERVKEVHPDREGGSRAAFKEVQRAYERLSADG